MLNDDLLQQQVAIAAKRLEIIRRSQAFDPSDPDSRPTESQLAVFKDAGKVPHRLVQGGNQCGKSLVGARELSWILQDAHPYFSRKERWGDDPLLAIIISRTTMMVEENIWEKKLKPLLDSSSYKEVRVGSTLQKIKFQNGDTILFATHHAPEEARDKTQGYVAHFVWIDELPDSYRLIEELQARAQSKNGLFLMTYTPKIKNEEIKRYIETPTEIHKVYRLSVLDNPIYHAGSLQRKTLLERLKSQSQEFQNLVLYGDWYSGDLSVYKFNSEANIKKVPEAYSTYWRHVASFDPAASSKCGLTIWAEDPHTHAWYCVIAKYVLGSAGSELVSKVEDELRYYHVIKRICDPNATWFIKEAAHRKIYYQGIYNKGNRKNELIKNLQERLLKLEIFITPNCGDLVDEFLSCQWHETSLDKIVNSQRFHLLDSAQYAVDSFPKPEKEITKSTGDPGKDFRLMLKEANKERKIKEALRIQKKRKWR